MNEFLAELMASIIFVGFVPGGGSGLVIGTVVSLAANGLEVWLGVDWLKHRLGSV